VRAVAAVVVVGVAVATLSGCNDTGETTEPGDATTTTTTVAEGATIPELPGPAGKCITSAATFLGLQLLALSGEDKARDAQAQVTKLKSELPESFHDDIDLVATTFGNLADKGIRASASELQDPKVKAAIESIAAEITKTCGA
jgi:hypothetical protein